MTDEANLSKQPWPDVERLRESIDVVSQDVAEASSTANRKYECEKRRRIYYQDIVYAVCNLMDRHIGDGGKIVCGTADSPSTAVQDVLRRLLDESRSRIPEAIALPFDTKEPERDLSKYIGDWNTVNQGADYYRFDGKKWYFVMSTGNVKPSLVNELVYFDHINTGYFVRNTWPLPPGVPPEPNAATPADPPLPELDQYVVLFVKIPEKKDVSINWLNERLGGHVHVLGFSDVEYADNFFAGWKRKAMKAGSESVRDTIAEPDAMMVNKNIYNKMLEALKAVDSACPGDVSDITLRSLVLVREVLDMIRAAK